MTFKSPFKFIERKSGDSSVYERGVAINSKAVQVIEFSDAISVAPRGTAYRLFNVVFSLHS
jgi:hypothetical protein